MSAPGLDWRVTWSRARNHEGVARGVRAFVALLCVLLLGWWAGWESSFMPAMLGVIASALAETDDGWRGRLRAQLLTLVAFAVVGVAVQASQPLPLLQAWVLAAAALALTLVGALGERYRAVALGVLVFAIYIAMLGHQGRTDQALVLLLLGATWYGVVSVLWAALLPRATLRHRMSRLYALLGEQLRLKAQLLEPVRDVDLAGRRMALALHNGRVVLALTATKESLFSRLQDGEGKGDGPRPVWLQLAMRQYLAAQDIHERVNSSHEDYGLLAESLFHSDALYRCQRVLTQLGAQLLKFAEAIAARGSPVHTGSTARAIEDMQAAIAHLLAGPLPQQSGAARALGAVQQLGRNLTAMAGVLPALEQPLQGGAGETLHDRGPRDWRAAWQRVRAQLHGQSPLLRHGLRLALTLLLGSAIVAMTRDPHGYWVLLTIVFVSQPRYADTRHRMVQRATGTALGLCLGWAAIRLFPATVLQSALLVVAGGLFLGSRHTHYTRATASVTVLLLLSFHQAGMGDGVIPTRMLDTVVGGVLAWLAAWLVLPNWQSRQWPQLAEQALRSQAEYLQEIVAQAGTGKQDHLAYRLARRNAHNADAALSNAYAAMLKEPAHARRLFEACGRFLVLSHTLLNYLSALGAHRGVLADAGQDALLRRDAAALGAQLTALAARMRAPQGELATAPVPGAATQPQLALAMQLLPQLQREAQGMLPVA
ncbi:YccS family putative transporter [Pseudorhodoferax sp. LjRoot39]|uniref:YccS family putative transporter n=1 Tax=Pseudorhodoferax sp. LjRoot39 TaxID=3342328 RepID=UPI003ECFE0F9